MTIFVTEKGRESLPSIREFSRYEEGALDNMAERTFHLSDFCNNGKIGEHVESLALQCFYIARLLHLRHV